MLRENAYITDHRIPFVRNKLKTHHFEVKWLNIPKNEVRILYCLI